MGSVPGSEDPLEEKMATHSGILAWRIPWRSLSGYSSWGHKELDMTKQLPRTHINISFSHLDEKNNITSLKGFKERHTAEDYQRIIDRMIEVAKKNKKVVFVGNFENPQTEVEGFIFLEITDISDPLKIFVEDKSRGSDYGD